MWLMFWYYLFFGAIDVLKWLMFEVPPAWSMFLCGWCFVTVYFFCVVDVLMRLMFEIPQRISLANTDVWGPSGKKYIKTSWSLSVFSQACSMFWCGWCFGIIYFLVWLMFWSGWCLRSLQHDQCFDVVDVSVLTIFLVWLMFRSSWYLRSLSEYRSPTNQIFQCHQRQSLVDAWGISGNEKYA